MNNDNEPGIKGDDAKFNDSNLQKTILTVIMNAIIARIHAGSLGLICYYIINSPSQDDDNQRRNTVVLLVVANVCISVIWWENFVLKGKKESGGLPGLKRFLIQCKSKILFITMFWNLFLTICVLPVIYGSFLCGRDFIDMIYFKHSGDIPVQSSTIFVDTPLTDGSILSICEHMKKWLLFILSFTYIFRNGLCFKVGKAACIVVAQRVAFGLPLTLTPPIALVTLLY